MVTVSEIEAARRRLPPEVVRKPLLACPAVDGAGPVFLKAESLQEFQEKLYMRMPLPLPGKEQAVAHPASPLCAQSVRQQG